MGTASGWAGSGPSAGVSPPGGWAGHTSLRPVVSPLVLPTKAPKAAVRGNRPISRFLRGPFGLVRLLRLRLFSVGHRGRGDRLFVQVERTFHAMRVLSGSRAVAVLDRCRGTHRPGNDRRRFITLDSIGTAAAFGSVTAAATVAEARRPESS